LSEPSLGSDVATPSPEPEAGLGAFALGVLGVLALLARLPGLGRSLWYDELFTLSHFSSSPIDALTRQIAANNHPPASLLAWVSSAFASGEVGLRLPFAAAGAAGVVALGWAVGRWAGRPAGLLAGGVAAIAPVHVLASQQIRGYPLMLLAAALLIGLLPALMGTRSEDPFPRRVFGLVVAATAAGVWSHATFFAGVGGTLACVALLAEGRARRLALAGLGLGAAGGALLLAPVISRTFKFVRKNVGVAPPEGLHPGPLELDHFGVVLGDGAVLPLILMGLAGVGVGRVMSSSKRRVPLGVTLLGPVVGMVVLLMVRPLGYERFTLFALPALLGLGGIGCAGLVHKLRRRRPVAIATFGVLAVALGFSLRAQARLELQDYRGALEVASVRAATLEAPQAVLGLGPGAELCAAYGARTIVDLDGSELRARVAAGTPFVCVVPLPAWLEGNALRQVLWSDAFADPVLMPGRESSVLVFATRKR
jgi:mannosyltransferase